MEIILKDKIGFSFAEDKDLARSLRRDIIVPALEKNDDIILNFAGIELATQSFMHALLSELMRQYGPEILDRIQFKSCNDSIRAIISIVVDYMQE